MEYPSALCHVGLHLTPIHPSRLGPAHFSRKLSLFIITTTKVWFISLSLLAFCIIKKKKKLIIFLSPWFTCSFSQLLCENTKSNLILRSQGLPHWKHSKILCWTYEWRTCYFTWRLYVAGLATPGYVLSAVHWEAVLCSEKLSALQDRKPELAVNSTTFYLPVVGIHAVLSRHQPNRKNNNKKNFPAGFS